MCEQNDLQCLFDRRTVRHFTDEPVSRATLDELCEAARWAPSGINNQPWRFVTVESKDKLVELAGLTKSAKVLKSCTAAIAVFLDTPKIYHRDKDVQSIGAALENILLAAHTKGLGSCWLGEILNRRKEAERVLNADNTLELMAVVALGYPDPDDTSPRTGRTGLDSLIVGRL
jgi:nitroreductase